MSDEVYRYWHKPIEYCSACKCYRAINRAGLCPQNHQIHPDLCQYRFVNGKIYRGALSVPIKPPTHAQAAKTLREWNRQDSWRTIARKLLNVSLNGHATTEDEIRVNTVAVTLNGHARRKFDSDEVLELMGVAVPTRTRIAADVTVEQREALKRKAKRMGYSGWSEKCRAEADECIEMERRLAKAESQVAEMRTYNRKGE